MSALLSGLSTCKSLHTLRVNDNWLKNAATEILVGLILGAENLKELDVSDGNMGTVNVLVTLRALVAGSSKVRKFGCNYNDVESKKCAVECLELLLKVESLENIDFVGNMESVRLQKEWKAKFEGKEIRLAEDEECSDDDCDEEDECSEDEVDLTRLDEICAKFDQLALKD